jgi:hypothetical protein
MTDLITLQEFKNYMGLRKPDDDTKISFLISSVSSLIKAYLGYDLTGNYDTPVVEYASFDYDTNVYFPKLWPIRDVVEITEQDRYTWDSTIHVPLTAESDYYVSGDTIVRVPGTGGFGYWPQGPNTVKITYRAGYEDTPSDVKLAAIELVNYYKEEQFRQSKTIMGSTIINTLTKADEWPSHIRLLLDNYRNY